MMEYDFAANDNNNYALAKERVPQFWLPMDMCKRIIVGFNLKNITKNQDNVNVGNRTLQIDYIGSF